MLKTKGLRFLTVLPIVVWAVVVYRMAVAVSLDLFTTISLTFAFFFGIPLMVGFSLLTLSGVLYLLWIYLKWIYTGEWDDEFF